MFKPLVLLFFSWFFCVAWSGEFDHFEPYSVDLEWKKSSKSKYEYVAASPFDKGYTDYLACAGSSFTKCVYSFTISELELDYDLAEYAVVIKPEWFSAVVWPKGAQVRVEADGQIECLSDTDAVKAKLKEKLGQGVMGTLAICNLAKKDYSIEITGHHKFQELSGIITDVPLPMAFGFMFNMYFERKSKYCEPSSSSSDDSEDGALDKALGFLDGTCISKAEAKENADIKESELIKGSQMEQTTEAPKGELKVVNLIVYGVVGCVLVALSIGLWWYCCRDKGLEQVQELRPEGKETSHQQV